MAGIDLIRELIRNFLPNSLKPTDIGLALIILEFGGRELVEACPTRPTMPK
jgi:hypothetical protein